MYFSTCDQLFPDGQLSWNFNMAAAANLENKQTSNNGYCKKLKGIPKNCKYICERLSLYCICGIVIEFFFAHRQTLSAVVSGYHRAIKKQPQGVFEKKYIKYL